MKKLMVLFMAAVGLASVAFAAPTKGGANYKKAVSLGTGTKEVTTVAAIDPDDGEKYGGYEGWFKFTVTRGKAYTVIVTKNDPEQEVWSSLDDESMILDKDVYLPSFSSDTDPDGLSDRYILYADDWDDDPEGGHAKSGTFFLSLDSGEAAETVTVRLVAGVEEYEWPKGSSENPASISPEKDAKEYKGALSLDGEYYFKTSKLSVGHRYNFWTTGGTADNALTISISGDEVADPDLLDYTGKDQGKYDTGLSAVPTEKGAHIVTVTGDSGEMGKSFVLHYAAVPYRKIADHTTKASFVSISTEPQASECLPGNRNKKGSKYWDRTIDTSLYKVSLTKGKYYVFETQGADTNLLMEVYNADAEVVVQNRRGFADAARPYDCRIVYKAAATADYWVGVCQDLADDEAETATAGTCTFIVQELTDEMKILDAFDPADDKYTGATVLVPCIADRAKYGTVNGPHTLGATDRADYYSIICRKGLVYRLVAQAIDEDDLSARTFKLKTTISRLVDGKLTSEQTFEDLAAGFKFTAKANGTHYIKVEVEGGCGVDYGPHNVLAAVSSEKKELGYLDVEIGGATAKEGAGWSVHGDEKPVAVNAAGICVLPAGTYKIDFAAAEGWTAPKSKSCVVENGVTNEVAVKYNDLHDAADLAKDATEGDGSYSGEKRTTLKFEAKEKSERRSLWAEDPADWYYFKSTAFSRTRLILRNATGDAVLMVTNRSAGALVAENVPAVDFRATGAEKHAAAVTHADAASPVDSQYELAYSMVQIGQIAFTKSSVSVKDDEDTVSLTVSRTSGKAGKVSVSYETVDGSGEDAAVAGDHYIPKSGTLTWEDGKDGDKTITVKLLPQLRAHWDVSRKFKVVLTAVEAAVEGEETPFLGESSATVKIKPATKMACGTIQFSKTSASVAAGEELTLWLKRTGGDDGQVGVTVKASDGTAIKGTDYEALKTKTVVWEDGISTNQAITLVTKYAGDGTSYQATRKMSIKIAIDKDQPYAAKLGDNSKISVAIVDPNVTRTFEDYQSACKQMGGISIKAGAAESWYFDQESVFRSVTPAEKGKTATLTLTLTGPGKFAFTPQFENGGSSRNTAVCTIDGKAVTLTDGTRVLKYLKDGKHTVKFTVTRAVKNIEGNVSLAFENDADSGLPFLWKQLPKAVRVAPASGETVQPGGLLDWTVKDEDAEIYTFLTVATKESYLDQEAKALVYNATNEPAAEVSVVLGEEFPDVTWANGKTYYWRVDTAFVDETSGKVKLRNAGDVWSFKTCVKDAPKTVFKAGTTDAYGEDVEVPDEGMPYEIHLVQGVKVSSVRLAAENAEDGSVTYAKVGGKLPDGVKISSSGKLSGAPTKTGEFLSVLQVTKSVTTGKGKSAKTVETKGETLAVKFIVDPIGLAAGTFNGLVSTEDDRVAGCVEDGLGALAIGSVNVSVTAKGEITAKAVVGGTAYKFSGTCYNKVEPNLADTEHGVVARLSKVTKVYYKKKGKYITATNTLEITACCATEGEDGYPRVGLDCPMSVRLCLSVPAANDKKAIRDIVWTGHALRDNREVSSELKLIKQFAGYYTVSLNPMDYVEGESGYGYITATISSKGAAKVSGVLADGSTTFSASAPCGYLSDEASDCGGEVLIPVFTSAAKKSFGGWLRLCLDENGVPVVRVWTPDPEGVCGVGIRWINASASATLDGTAGFDMGIEPTGGYYDTVVNLQRHYFDIGYSLVIPTLDLNGLADYLLSNYWCDFVAYPGCRESGEEPLVLKGNGLSAEAQKLKYRTDDKKLVDWAKTTNPSNLKFSFTRATGIYSGSFELWKGNDVAGYETKQKKIGTYKHKGVLLLTRSADAALAFEDNVAPGFFTAKVTVKEEDGDRSVTANYPFVVAPKEIEKPWLED